MYALKLNTAATAEPLTLVEAKQHMRITEENSEDDELIAAAITVATELAQNELRRVLITQTWDILMDELPCGREILRVPLAPLQSVTHLKYYDAANIEQTLDPLLYQVDVNSVRPRVLPVWGQIWPDTYPRLQAVELRVVVGYGAAAAVPKPVKQWMLCAIGAMYENRELVQERSELKMSPFLDGLLDPYRISEMR